MADDFSYDVFLSHSSKDRPVVCPIAEKLRADGLRVWLYEWEIRPGDSIPEKIDEGLEHSRVLVLCMSAQAFGPEWAQLEDGTFRFRDPLNKERRFIPLRLDETPIKGSLAQFLYINWRPQDNKEQAYVKLFEACRPPAKTPTAKEQAACGPFTQKAIKLKRLIPISINPAAFSLDGKRILSGYLGNAVRLWDVETGRCLRVLKGHTDSLNCVAWNINDRHVLSGSNDCTIRLWDVDTGRCLRVMEGHTGPVMCVAWSADGRHPLSGSYDGTLRAWDVEKQCCRVLAGHKGWVRCAAWSPDGRQALSGSTDDTLRLWDVEKARCLRVFEGHTNSVKCVAWSADGRYVLSGSYDRTLRLWDVKTGRCLRVMEGHMDLVRCVAWSADGRYALSGSNDRTLRLWDVKTGRCLRLMEGHRQIVVHVVWGAEGLRAYSCDSVGGIRVWEMAEIITEARALHAPILDLLPATDQTQYTYAKVLLVGESGVGKTGLTRRLVHDTFTPSFSTSGTWSTQLQMQDTPLEPGWKREVWLWDFGGQSDQRLIHQLHMEKTTLILLVFNADQDVVLPSLREWQQTLSHCVPGNARIFLVAGRVDIGIRFDREEVRAFAEQNGYRYFETSAYDGRGCAELRRAIGEEIPWTQLERRTSPTNWKLLKNQILQLRDERGDTESDNGHVLFTFKELREVLRQRLAVGTSFTDADLEAVISLLIEPGVVAELGFGTYILLRPEWISVYMQAVIRTLRADEKNRGWLSVECIAEGKLIFQARQASGEIVEQMRLGPREEPIVLQAVERMLVEHEHCLRQDDILFFPNYCGVEKPAEPAPSDYFVNYTFSGFLDEIYISLVVKLANFGAFKLKEIWRDAADFEMVMNHGTMGIKLLRNDDSKGKVLVHFGKNVTQQEQVVFADFIHAHLIVKATNVQRLRFNVCPHCGTPVNDIQEVEHRLKERGKNASIVCVRCEKRVPLWDELEECFTSDETKRRVDSLQKQKGFTVDARRKGKLLTYEVGARITSADQKVFEIPGVDDEGLDMEVEFTDDDGRGTGKRVFLQLKAGNSHLKRRASDEAEIFQIKKQSWVNYWIRQDYPVFLVIGTFPEEAEEAYGENQERFTDIRWMEISELLRLESKGGTQPVKQIVFKGERLDTMSVRRLRDDVLNLAGR
jgi:small GTP-binding protein